MGKTCLWADAIRPGYRSVKLFSPHDPTLVVATLLVHFRLRPAREETFTLVKALSNGPLAADDERKRTETLSSISSLGGGVTPFMSFGRDPGKPGDNIPLLAI